MPRPKPVDIAVASVAAVAARAVLGPTQGDDSYPPSDGLNMFGWPLPTDNSWLVFLSGVTAFLTVALALTGLRALHSSRKGHE